MTELRKPRKTGSAQPTTRPATLRRACIQTVVASEPFEMDDPL